MGLLRPGVGTSCLFRAVLGSEDHSFLNTAAVPTFDSVATGGMRPAAGLPGASERALASRYALRMGTGTAIALLAILVVATTIRFYGLDREGLWGDEYIQVAEYSLPPHYTALNAMNHHGIGPLDFLIGWVVHRVSPSVWAYRVPAAFCGVLAVAACFSLVRRLASVEAGLIAAGLLCLCPMHVVLSQEVRPYSIALLLLLLTLILFIRALEQPTVRRVAAFGFMAFMCPLTRSFTGVVFQLSLWLVLSIVLLRARRTKLPDRERIAVKRLWVATLAAGIATLPMFCYILYSLRVYTVLPSGYKQNFWGTSGQLVERMTRNAQVISEALGASFGPGLIVLAFVGLAVSLVKWKHLRLEVRCTLATLLLVGPIFFIVFAVMVRYQTMYPRYSFYLMPIVACFAAIGAASALAWLRTVLARRPTAKGFVVIAVIVGVFAYPVSMSAGGIGAYRRLDWRGCAAYLGEVVTPDDVVLVLSERPFGQPQITFRGKHDWERSKRPLAEALWTFATSDSHFERLTRKTGRCYTVITYLIEPQSKDAYLAQGLQGAPHGYRLVKFRGLDVLVRERSNGNLFGEILETCDDLLETPRIYESTNAVVHALKARVALHLGLNGEAAESYAAARSLVDPTHLDTFDHLTSSWAKDPTLVD